MRWLLLDADVYFSFALMLEVFTSMSCFKPIAIHVGAFIGQTHVLWIGATRLLNKWSVHVLTQNSIRP